MIFAINAAGAPAAFPVPLVGFEQSYSGPPVDSQKQYSEARRSLMQQIAQRQQEMMEEYKKQQAAKRRWCHRFSAAGCSPAGKE